METILKIIIYLALGFFVGRYLEEITDFFKSLKRKKSKFEK